MNRRGFLQGILAAGMAPAVVQAASLMPVFARRESGLLEPGPFREIAAYDLFTDRTVVRIDTLVGFHEVGVTYAFHSGQDGDQAHEEAMLVLTDDLKARGAPLYLCKAPPMPPKVLAGLDMLKR